MASVPAGRRVRMPAPRLVALAAALALGCSALAACDRVAEVTGPDPADAATALAAGLAAGDLAERRLHRHARRPRRARRTTRIVAGHGRRRAPGRGRRGQAVRRAGDRHPDLDLAARRRRVDLRRRGGADHVRRRLAGALGAVAGRALAGRRRGARRSAASRPTAATSSARGGASRWSPTGRSCGSASTGRRSGRRRAGGVRPPAGRAGRRSTPAPYAKRVAGRRRRRRSSRRSSTGARTCRPSLARHRPASPARSPWPTSCRSAPTKEFAAPILGTRRARSPPRWSRSTRSTYRAGDVAGPLRPPGALRRAAARHARRRRGGGAGQDPEPRARTRASCSGWTRPRGEPLRTTLDPDLETEAERLLAGRRPGQRPGRDPPLAPAPSWPPPTGRATDGYNLATFGQLAPGLDVQEREQPGAAARRADARHRWCRAPRAITVDGKQLHELLRLPGQRDRADPAAHRARQLVQHRLHLPGRPSSAHATSATRPPRSASGSTTTSASRRTSAACRRPASETEAGAPT